jgi:hypothetical protein
MSKLNWYGERVRVQVNDAAMESLAAIAHAIEGQAKVNIREQPVSDHIGLIDTGFYVNSVYVVTQTGDDTYGQTDPSGTYRDREGQAVERTIAPRAGLPPGVGALVAIGAAYAIWLEEEFSPLFRAAESVAQRAGGLVKKV